MVTDIELCGWLPVRRVVWVVTDIELCGWLLLWSCVGGY